MRLRVLFWVVAWHLERLLIMLYDFFMSTKICLSIVETTLGLEHVGDSTC